MPMYEFRCMSCGEDFEELVRTVDEAVTCPECDSADVQRKLSTFAHRTTGSAAPNPSTHSASSSCGSCGGGHCGSCGH